MIGGLCIGKVRGQCLVSKHVMSILRDEIDEMREWAGMMSTVLHTQLSGGPIRFRILHDLVAHAKGCGGIWIAPAREIATCSQPAVS